MYLKKVTQSRHTLNKAVKNSINHPSTKVNRIPDWHKKTEEEKIALKEAKKEYKQSIKF